MLDVTKTHVARELAHDSPIVGCRFHPDGEHVYFAAQDQKVWRWKWQTAEKTPFVAHDSWVRAIGFANSGQTLVSGGYDGRLIWWQALGDNQKPQRSVQAHHGWIRALSVSPDEQLVCTVGNDQLVKLWNASDGSLIRSLSGHESHVYNTVFHPNGEQLVTGDLKGNLIHWEVSSGREMRRIKAESLYKYDGGFRADIGGFRGLCFNHEGTELAGSGITNVTNAFAGVGNPAVVVFNWDDGKLKIQHESKGKLKGVAWGVVLHPESLTIGISGGGGGGFLLFWKPDEKEEFHHFKLPNTARDLDLAADGIHLVTGHHDRKVRVSRMRAKSG